MNPCNPCTAYNFSLTPERVPNFRGCGCDNDPPCKQKDVLTPAAREPFVYDWSYLAGVIPGTMVKFAGMGPFVANFNEAGQRTLMQLFPPYEQVLIPGCAKSFDNDGLVACDEAPTPGQLTTPIAFAFVNGEAYLPDITSWTTGTDIIIYTETAGEIRCHIVNGDTLIVDTGPTDIMIPRCTKFIHVA